MSREFVINIINEWFIESANYTCSPFNPEINEMEIAHLTPIPSIKVTYPGDLGVLYNCVLLGEASTSGRVCLSNGMPTQAPLRYSEPVGTYRPSSDHHPHRMTCISVRSGAVHATMFVGEIVMFHANRSVLTTTPSGKAAIDILKFQPMCRLGGNTYGRVTSIFDLPRPDRTV